MQLEHVLKKFTFDLLSLSLRQVGEMVVAGKIFATMLLHFMIHFNLICKMTTF